jgi:hypothetical protein
VTATVIDEPASAVAAALCLSARDRDGVTRRHPRRCGWCDYPAGVLRSMVEGFNAWAGYDDRRGTYDRHDARVFQGLPRARQAELVRDAQGFEEDVPW